MRSVGQPVRMREAAERVTGRLPFVASHSLPGLLHARVLRSSPAHARLLHVDTRPAEALPGVVGVLSGRDLADPRINPTYGPILPDRCVVATDRVRYAGEPLAVVIAEDEERAVEAVRLIEVEAEELPAVFDPLAAIQPDAPPIHDHVQRREFLTFPDLVLNTEAGKNIFNHFKLRRGDVEAGFAAADEVFEHTYRTPAQQHVSLEPHVAICQIQDGQVRLWSSASSPFTARFQVAETLRVPQAQVRVITWNIGGAFGGKTYPRIEPLVALASWKVGGRPVRLAFSRAEEFATITRHAAVVTLKTGVRRDGTLLARQARVLWSAGAYADISPRVAKNGGYSAIGPYRVPNVWVDSYAVYTNVTPAGGFRGYGVPQVTWAYESQMDEIAAGLGLDPLEVRRRNLAQDGDLFATGQPFEDTHFFELLERCQGLPRPVGEALSRGEGWLSADTQPSPGSLRSPGLSSPRGRGELSASGRGVAITVKTTVTPSTSTANLKLEEDGSVSILASTTEVGQGSRTVLAQIVADALGVPIDRVHQAYPDTALTPWDQTTSSSRSTLMMGEAVRAAADDILGQLRRLASELLEVAEADVEVGDGAAWVRGVPDTRLTYADIVRRARRGNLLGTGTAASEGHLDPETGQGIATNRFFQAACAADVSVDLATGRVTVDRLNLQTYAGKVVHPVLAELQSEGNAAFGVGQALLEEIVLDEGQVQNATLGDYMIPSLLDLPPSLDVGLLEDPGGAGAIHGLGESGSPVVPAAIGNAVFAACGVRVRDLPITPEKVLRELRELEAREAANGGE